VADFGMMAQITDRVSRAVGARPADDFMLVAVTPENIFEGEAASVVALLEGGIDRVHVRHPRATDDDVAALLDDIPCDCRCRLSLHGHRSLLGRYPGVGVHLNAAHPEVPEEWRGVLTRSCHSIPEVLDAAVERMDYVFLSPVYDSITKSGYLASQGAINNCELQIACRAIPVVALSGVTPDKFDELRSSGFKGGAMLGWIWKDIVI